MYHDIKLFSVTQFNTYRLVIINLDVISMNFLHNTYFELKISKKRRD